MAKIIIRRATPLRTQRRLAIKEIPIARNSTVDPTTGRRV